MWFLKENYKAKSKVKMRYQSWYRWAYRETDKKTKNDDGEGRVVDAI